ncbi:MAG: hypothetical protein ACKV0T_31495 [Planctomycetales bacterium]
MSETQKGSWRVWIVGAGIACLLLYILSFGPVVAFLNSPGVANDHPWMGTAVEVLFLPVILVGAVAPEPVQHTLELYVELWEPLFPDANPAFVLPSAPLPPAPAPPPLVITADGLEEASQSEVIGVDFTVPAGTTSSPRNTNE